MVQQKRKEIKFHQESANNALALFNELSKLPDNTPIFLNITFHRASEKDVIAIPKKIRKGLLLYIQRLCEYHMNQKFMLQSGIEGNNNFPEVPEWFAHFFCFCAECGISPLSSDMPQLNIAYTVASGKHGALCIQFEKKVKYKDVISLTWKATHAGAFEKL